MISREEYLDLVPLRVSNETLQELEVSRFSKTDFDKNFTAY